MSFVYSRMAVRFLFITFSLALLFSTNSLANEPTIKSGSAVRSIEFFETKVRPILAESCIKCHGPKKQSSGLRLDSREAILKGGENGPAVVPGDADHSLVVKAVTYEHEEIKMPPKARLADTAVSAIRLWVSEGAYWPDTGVKSVDLTAEAAKRHWAFQPIRRTSPPKIINGISVDNPVDAFVGAKLEASGLKPSSPADRRTLIRRLSYDLLGLPPTADEIRSFEADKRPDAYARLVDRLLANPAYGERWGRHWLDVARYADTKGYVFTEERNYPFSYTYRDYVVSAFNRDLRFDEFIIQQIAADKLSLGDDPRPLAAMGFLTVGRRFLNDQNEIIDDRIDVVGRGLLGLTVTCARCHDHKFDPIPSADYYSLYGVFASSLEPTQLPRLLAANAKEVTAEEEQAKKVQAVVAKREAYLAERHTEATRDFEGRFSRYFRAASEIDFNPKHSGLSDLAKAQDLDVNRLRALSASLRRGLELVTNEKGRESILQAWRAYSGLKPEEFQGKNSEILAGLKAKEIHPLLAKILSEKPPTRMADVLDQFTNLFTGLETRLKSREPKAKPSLSEPEWESLRQAIFGPNGVATLTPDSDRFLLKRAEKERLAELDKAIDAVKAAGPPPVPRGMVMNDAPNPVEPHVFIRGNPGRPGKAVPRQFLNILSGSDRKPFKEGSGRLELARSIVDPKNPLTARVLVNRVWAWHFGSGLVTTPSDLGIRSDPPSHPELLDWLADELIRSGWSLKSLQRLILLSNTYQQSSELRPECQERDPQNRLVWRFNRQRLDFEGMRDAVLAVSGELDRRVGGPPSMLSEEPFPRLRTLYGFIDRQNLDPVYRTFDFAVPDTTTPRRFVTTVPQQALFMMNSPFLQEQARKLAAEVDRVADSSDLAERVKRLYLRVLGRTPVERELTSSARFFSRQTEQASQEGSFGSNDAESKAELLSPLEQLAQVLLLTNEFSFID